MLRYSAVLPKEKFQGLKHEYFVFLRSAQLKLFLSDAIKLKMV